MIKVIGIDPGLASTGVAIVEGAGLKVDRYSYAMIHTSPNERLPDRLNRIFQLLCKTLENECPDVMVVEDVFSLQKYPKSGITLGKVTGVILLAGCRMQMPILEVPVREAKQILTGSGSAGKKQLEACVRHRLQHPGPITPDHVSDALALALVGLYRTNMGHG